MHSERHYVDKEIAAHAKAEDAAFENNTEEYYKQNAKAERYAERAERKHDKHVAKKSKHLHKEEAERDMVQESLARGDTEEYSHHEAKAARYRNKAGRTNGHKHYPPSPTHAYHGKPPGYYPPPGYYREGGVPIGMGGVIPTPMMGTYGGYGDRYLRPSPYFEAPPHRRGLPIGRDFSVVGLKEPDFFPTNRPLGISPEFRRGYGKYW